MGADPATKSRVNVSLPLEEAPELPTDPVKQSDSSPETQPEIPKVGATDAPGG
jgi:hypothetical protein